MNEVQELIKLNRDLIKVIENSTKNSDESVKPFDRLMFRITGVFFVIGIVFFISNIMTSNSRLAVLEEIVKENITKIKENKDENGGFLSITSFISIEEVRNKRIVSLIVENNISIREEELEAARTRGYERLNEPIHLGTIRATK